MQLKAAYFYASSLLLPPSDACGITLSSLMKGYYYVKVRNFRSPVRLPSPCTKPGAERPLIFGTSVVADCVDLHKYPDAQSWCPAHRIVEGVDAPVIPDSHVELYDEASIANARVVPFDLWLTGSRRQIIRYLWAGGYLHTLMRETSSGKCV